MQLSGGAKETRASRRCLGAWKGCILCVLRRLSRQRAAVVEGQAVQGEWRGGRKGVQVGGWQESRARASETLVVPVSQSMSKVR